MIRKYMYRATVVMMLLGMHPTYLRAGVYGCLCATFWAHAPHWCKALCDKAYSSTSCSYQVPSIEEKLSAAIAGYTRNERLRSTSDPSSIEKKQACQYVDMWRDEMREHINQAHSVLDVANNMLLYPFHYSSDKVKSLSRTIESMKNTFEVARAPEVRLPQASQETALRFREESLLHAWRREKRRNTQRVRTVCTLGLYRMLSSSDAP